MFGVGGGNASKHGLYKNLQGEYCTGSGKNKKVLSGQELQEYFQRLITSIVKALDLVEQNKISEIKNLSIPMALLHKASAPDLKQFSVLKRF